MKRLIPEDEIAFRKHWKSLKKDILIDKLWEMLQFIECQTIENEELKGYAQRANAQYLSNCRSVGGVTLPPGGVIWDGSVSLFSPTVSMSGTSQRTCMLPGTTTPRRSWFLTQTRHRCPGSAGNA